MSQTIACKATLKSGHFGCSVSPEPWCKSQHSINPTALLGTCRDAELLGEPCFHLYPKFQTLSLPIFPFHTPCSSSWLVWTPALPILLCSFSPHSHCTTWWSPTAKFSDILYHFWGRVSARMAVKESSKAAPPCTTWKLHCELFSKALPLTGCDLHLFLGGITAEIRQNMMDSLLLNGNGLSMEITTDNALHFNVISFLLITPRRRAWCIFTTWCCLQGSSKVDAAIFAFNTAPEGAFQMSFSLRKQQILFFKSVH